MYTDIYELKHAHRHTQTNAHVIRFRQNVQPTKLQVNTSATKNSAHDGDTSSPFFSKIIRVSFKGDRSTLGTMSTRSLGTVDGDGSPRLSRRSSRSSLRKSHDTLSVGSRSATADAVFEKEFGAGKEVGSYRPSKWF